MNIFCDECKKNIATVFLTKISGSEVSKVQLCEECAKRMEETTEAANLLAFLPQILSGMQGMDEHLVEDVLSGELLACESCGTSFNDFQKIGFLGCSKCYTAFGEPLAKVIAEFQEGEEHVGKMPGKVSEGARLRKKLMDLERHLEHQIAEERYEAAATVRDQIREIEGKLQIDGSDSEPK
jgi:protein arginine kinase activator